MGELLDLLEFLYEAGAAVIPWLVLAMAAYMMVKAWPHVSDWIQARAKAQQAVVEREAERNEIMRNNNIVIENCNETMGMIKRFMERTDREQCNAIEHHEQLSAERIERIQERVDTIASEQGKLRGDIGILMDRVH